MFIRYNRNLKPLARRLRNEPTRSEARLWYYLRGKQMMGFRFIRQKPIGKYIVDFFCNELQLVIELDGLSHEFEGIIYKDQLKQVALTKLGLTVLRFDDDDVMDDLENVLDEIEGNIKVVLDRLERRQVIHS